MEGRGASKGSFQRDWTDGSGDWEEYKEPYSPGSKPRRWMSTEEIVDEQARVVSHVLGGGWDEELLGNIHIQGLNWAIKARRGTGERWTLGQRRRVDLSARLFSWLHDCGRATSHTFSKYVEACALAGRPALAQAAWTHLARADPRLLNSAYALSHLVRAHCEAGDVAAGEAALAEAYASEHNTVTHFAVGYVMEAALRLGRPKAALKAFHEFRHWLQGLRGRNYVFGRTGLDGEEYDEVMGGVWTFSDVHGNGTGAVDGTADGDGTGNARGWAASPAYNGADLSGAWADRPLQGWYWLGEENSAQGAPFPLGGPRRLPGMNGTLYVLALQALQAAGGWHLTPALCRCMDQDGIRPSQQMCTLIFRLLGQAGLAEEALGFLKFLYPDAGDPNSTPVGKDDQADVIQRNALLRGYAESCGPGEFGRLLARLLGECGHVLDSWTLVSQLRCATRLGEGMPAGGHPTLPVGPARRFVRRVGEAVFARVRSVLCEDTRRAASPCNALMSLYLALGEPQEALRVLRRMEGGEGWPPPDVVSLRKAREAAVRTGDTRLQARLGARLEREEAMLKAHRHSAGMEKMRSG